KAIVFGGACAFLAALFLAAAGAKNFAGALMAGGCLGAVNLWLLSRVVRKLRAAERLGGRLIATWMMKWAVLGIGLLIALRRGLSPVGLLIGLSTILIFLAAAGVHDVPRSRVHRV